MTRAEDFGWGRGEQPVVNISWQEIATIYLPWLNERLGLRGAEAYRLPSDGEWEYAARAGSTTRYPGGPLLSKERANFHAAPINAPRGRPLPIGRHAPNAFGVVDMIGNVAEWVEDCLTFPSSAVRDLPTDGRARTKTVFEETCGSNELRVVRGGSYNQTAESVRVTARVLTASTTRSPQIGVRLARTLAGTRPSGPPVPTQVGPVFR
jgi:formylglycine-generating enzyme required for sulfatase activity